MNIKSCKQERSRARKEIKMYLLENASEIEKEFGIKVPENIKSMKNEELSFWINLVSKKILTKRNCKELEHYELVELIKDYKCAETNLSFAETNFTIDREQITSFKQ